MWDKDIVHWSFAACVFVRNQDFVIRRGLKPKKKVQKYKMVDVLSILVLLKPITDGGLGVIWGLSSEPLRNFL